MTATLDGLELAAPPVQRRGSERPVRPAWPAPRPRRRSARPRPWSALAGAVVLAVVLTWAVAPGWFTSWDPIATSPKDKLLPPGVEHWFGTDQIGRDVFARVVYGSRTTIQATVIAVGIGLVAGSVLGAVAGFLGGRTDSVVMRCVDVLLAIPNLLLAMVVVTALGFGSLNVAVAVGLSAVASFARVMRAEVVRVRASPYVEAAFAGGERTVQVLLRHILPNSWGPVLALSALEFGGAVLAVSALSFLGYGVVPPDPEWGSLIAEGRNWLASAWWLTTLPGLVVVVVVVSANHLGRSVGRWRGERA